MSPDVWIERIDRIDHMHQAIADIETAIAGVDLAAFRLDRTRQNAVFWSLSMLGEAAKHVPEQVRERHPEVPWRLARAMRNFLVHQYESIDLSIVWESAMHDLPGLQRELEQLREKARKGGA